MPGAFIFDVDGTLIDSVDFHAKAWQEALAHFGYRILYEEIRHQIGKGGDQLLPVFVPADALEQIGEQIEKYRTKLFKREYLPHIRPFPGVRDLFMRIRMTATSSRWPHPADLLAHYEELQRFVTPALQTPSSLYGP